MPRLTVIPGLDQSIDRLNSVDTSTSGVLEDQLDNIRNEAFYAFFNDLLTVMNSFESKAKIEPTEGPPKTPDRPIPPRDPNRTDGSAASNITSSTSEGKPEEACRQLAHSLLAHVLGQMGNDFRTIRWSKSPYTLRLAQK